MTLTDLNHCRLDASLAIALRFNPPSFSGQDG